MRNKMDDVQGFVINNNCDVLILAETWLHERESFLFNINKYKAVHSCRPTRGGGVSIYIKEGIKFTEIEKSEPNETINWVCIGIGKPNLKISAIYKPPSYDNDEFLTRLESILGKYPKRMLMVGDFNINLLSSTDVTRNYVTLLTLNNFKIANNIDEASATRVTDHNKSIIDHVLIDQYSNINCLVDIKNNCLSDHKLLSITVDNNIESHKPKVDHEIKRIDYKKFKYLFKNKIDSVNVESFQELIDLIKICKFESEYVRKIRIRENNEWMNKEILDLMGYRDRLYDLKIKNQGDLQIASEFKKIKNKINNKIKVLKNRYFQNKWNQAGTNPKKQWNFINQFIKNKSGEQKIISLNIDNVVVEDTVDIVNSLNKHFTQVGKSIVTEIETEINLIPNFAKNKEIYCKNSMYLNATDELEICEIIQGLKVDSAPGHDQISVLDITNLKADIVPILKKLISNILLSGTFPQELKTSRVNPIYKSGKKNCMNNYRPISVVSVLSKIVEKVIKKRMLYFIEKYIPVDEFQYGFVRNSSTLSATVDLVNHISRALDNKQIVVAVFVDLKKAFDVVSFDILLDKLQTMGFRGNIHKLIQTYLCDREQYVGHNGVCSDLLTNTYGVPQGSVLGPLLYSLYVLNLKCANLQARYFTFADDTVLVYTGLEAKVLNQIVNADLRVYMQWLLSNKIKINVEKTKYMLFKQKNKIVENMDITINDFNLQRVSVIKYLGLHVDENLSWSEHVSNIRQKVMPMIPIMFRCRGYLSDKSKNIVYNAFFLSHFRYLLPVWGMCGSTIYNKMQVLQNKILKVIYGYDRRAHTNALYGELNVWKLDKLLEFEQCKLIYKIINKQQKCNTKIVFSNEVHEYETRAQNNIYQIYTRSDIGLRNPIVSASRTYNRLPQCNKSINNFNLFVTKLRHHLDLG